MSAHLSIGNFLDHYGGLQCLSCTVEQCTFLGTTSGRSFAYLKTFLKRPKHKPGTFYIKGWFDHRKMKTNGMREFSELLAKKRIFHVEGDIDWGRWKEFKVEYHVIGSSMPYLVKEHADVLKLKGNKRLTMRGCPLSWTCMTRT